MPVGSRHGPDLAGGQGPRPTTSWPGSRCGAATVPHRHRPRRSSQGGRVSDSLDPTDPVGPSLDLDRRGRLAVDLSTSVGPAAAVLTPGGAGRRDDPRGPRSRWHLGQRGGPTWAAGEWQSAASTPSSGSPRPPSGTVNDAWSRETYGLGGYLPASAHEAIAPRPCRRWDREQACPARDLSAGIAATLRTSTTARVRPTWPRSRWTESQTHDRGRCGDDRCRRCTSGDRRGARRVGSRVHVAVPRRRGLNDAVIGRDATPSAPAC